MKNSDERHGADEKHAGTTPRVSLRAEEVALPEVCVYDECEDELICVSVEAIEFEDVALPEITHCAWETKEREDDADRL